MKKKRLESFVGASVMYCGHDGWFPADITVIGNAVVVHAGIAPVSGDTITRGENTKATHQIVDFPSGGFWKPKLGVFVVPIDQVRLTK